MREEMYMEDVNHTIVETIDALTESLDKFSITISTHDEDRLFDYLQVLLEEYCKNDYRNHN